jgi:chromate transporter
MLLVAGALPFWNALRREPGALAAMRGANAAVVGLLAAALYDPVWTGTVHGPADVALALTGFMLLTAWNAPPVLVVALGALAGGVV